MPLANPERHEYEPSEFATQRETETGTVPCAECGCKPGATIHRR